MWISESGCNNRFVHWYFVYIPAITVAMVSSTAPNLVNCSHLPSVTQAFNSTPQVYSTPSASPPESGSMPPPVCPNTYIPPQPPQLPYFTQPPGIVPSYPVPPLLPACLPPPVFGVGSVASAVACPVSSCTPTSSPAVSSNSSSCHKRRFREEKEVDELSDNLLGYQVCLRACLLLQNVCF